MLIFIVSSFLGNRSAHVFVKEYLDSMIELYPLTEVKISQVEFLHGKNNNLRFQSYNWINAG